MVISAKDIIIIVLEVIMVGIVLRPFLRTLKEIISDMFSFRADGPMASDGHRVPEDQDVSCQQFGHQHEEFETSRFIPHKDPEEGYIVINGVTMGRNEADRYQNRI